MSTQIQFLRTDQAQLRPDPNVLANGMPLLNFNENEPGLFFKARDGSLIKVGPTAVGELAPNTGANGYPGNTLGEMWLDTSGLVSELKVYDGVDWVIPGAGDTQVSSVGLSMPNSVFEVENSPITSAGTLEVNLQPQVRNRVFAGPIDGAAQTPTFRALVSDDVPGLDGSKIVAGFINQARIPSLDATKITSGVFNSARIPGIDATKIISGVLPYQFGGTGIGSTPQNGELLIGGLSSGWRKTTLQAGPGIGIVNGPGTIQVKVQPSGANGGVLFNNNGSLATDSNLIYDGTANILDLSGTLEVTGQIKLEYAGLGPSSIEFKGSTGPGVTLRAPTAVSAAYSLSLPTTLPVSPVDNILKADNSGNLSFSDTLALNNVSVRDTLSIQNSFTGFETGIVSNPSLAADNTLTLPATFGTGGVALVSSTGVMTVSQSPSVTTLSASTVSATELKTSGGSPARTAVSGCSSLAVSSNGTYTLIDIPTAGSPAMVSFTVFAHDETAAVGTGTLTQTFNAHYDGSTAVLSAGSDKVDSWSATTEPSFSVDTTALSMRVRVTTASGSNQLKLMAHYTYIVNVTSTPP